MANIDPIDDELLYEPPPPIEEWFTKAFNKIVPLSPNLKDRMLRFTWGNDALEYVAGRWERRYGDSDNDPPKYVGRCRWVLEGWQSPEIYDKEEWLKDEHLLGPYPENGTFDFIAYHENVATGEYLPLDQSALNHVEIWAHWQGKGQKRSLDELMAAKHALWHKRHEERQRRAAEVSTKFGEDVVKCFNNASETPTAFSLPSAGPAYEKTASGILIPKK